MEPQVKVFMVQTGFGSPHVSDTTSSFPALAVAPLPGAPLPCPA